MLMAPSCSGETWTPALGDNNRYLPRLVLGCAGGVEKDMMLIFMTENYAEEIADKKVRPYLKYEAGSWVNI